MPKLDPPRAAVLACLVLAALLPVAPLLWLGTLPLTHENLRYPLLLEHFRDMLAARGFVSGWLPRLHGGNGLPVFVFYQPLAFLVAAASSLVTGGSISAWLLALTAFSALGAAGMFVWLRRSLGVAPALAGTLLFAAAPYHTVNLAVRGDLSEFCAWMLLPGTFALLGSERALARRALLPLFGAALVATHPLVALVSAPALGAAAALTVWAAAPAQRLRLALDFALAVASALLLAAPYWLPFALARGDVALHLTTAGSYRAADHVVEPAQLLGRFLQHAGDSASRPGGGDGLSFSLGLVHAATALIGLAAACHLAARPRASAPGRAALANVLVASAVGGVAIALLLPWSAPFWDLPGPHWIQFPWRLLGLVAVCLSPASALAFALVPARLRGVAFAGAALLAALWAEPQWREVLPPARAASDAAVRAIAARDASSWQTYSSADEFIPRARRAAKLQPGLGIRATGSAALDSGGSSLHFRRARVEAATPVVVCFGQSWFPGWVVEVDGVRQPDSAARDAEGEVCAEVAAGSHALEAYYAGPPGQRLAFALFTLGLASLAWPLVRRGRD